MGVPVTIEDPDDVKFAVLGDAAGYSTFEAVGRMAKLWSYCTARQTGVLSEAIVRGFLGPAGVEAIVTSEFGEETPDGIRIRGTGGRIDWYAKAYQRKEAKRAGGLARAAQAARAGGKFTASGSPAGDQQPPADAGDESAATFVPAEQPPAATSSHQQTTSRPPADHQQTTSRNQLSDSDLFSDPRSPPHARAREGAAPDRHRQVLYAVWDDYRAAYQRCNDAIERGQAPGIGVNPVGGGTGADLHARLRELVAEFDGNYAECERILRWCVRVAEAKATRDRNLRLLAVAFEPSDVKAARGETDLAAIAAQRPSSLARGDAKLRRDEATQRASPRPAERRDEPRPVKTLNRLELP